MSSHLFDVDIAIEYGMEEAVVIQHLSFWVQKHRVAGTHRHDGKTWVFYSAGELSALHPYWTEKQVRRIMSSLIEHGVLVTGCFNESPYDRTRWFAFADEQRFAPIYTGKTSLPDEKIDLPKRANESSQTVTPIPLKDSLKDSLKDRGETQVFATTEEWRAQADRDIEDVYEKLRGSNAMPGGKRDRK